MAQYKNLAGDSGVIAYELGRGSITIQFAKGAYRTYLYDSLKPGAVIVAELIRLAVAGQGLNSYINRYVKKNYASRW
ncbi:MULTISPECIES: hypothetical protein [Pseudomonas]|uniref:KTSC domain-containing protein n=1 Tax=Pseudomonas fluorescens TaxID=294 RepID=A0A7Z3C0P1_PSEFL|nr:hypothetical protein [Pseudomonas fluorescens]QJP93320.1 hypothetical protein C6Y56_01510 [Pseudomonas fluorescens]